MKIRPLLAVWIAVFWVTACTYSTDSLPERERSVVLNAAVTSVHPATRLTTRPYRGTEPTADAPLEAAVWFSKESGIYRDNPDADADTHLPIHSTITYVSDGYTYPDKYNGSNLKYPVSNLPVYCVGLYPATGWSVDAACTVATHALDGETDVMFADQMTGTWNVPFETQTFRHLQTWLKILVCATSDEAARAWGNVSSIQVPGMKSLSVTLADGSVTYKEETTWEAVDGVVPLGITLKEVGNLFCTPALSYTLKVVTPAIPDGKEVTVPLMHEDGSSVTDIEEVTGRLFVMTLYFNEHTIITGSCTLNAWSSQDEVLYPD